jgi:prepilin peptidase CpaA
MMILMVSLVSIGLLSLATWHDLRTREIPNWISLALAGCGAIAVGLGWGANTWLGFLVGAILGLVVTFPFFALEGLGGGDVKLLVALGATFGPGTLLILILGTALFGGALALVALLRGKKDYAYCPAILASFVVVVALGLVVHGRIV